MSDTHHYEAVLSGISALPPELLLLVFQEIYAAQPPRGPDIERLLDSTRFPRSCVGVCRRWRDIIFAVPRFSTDVVLSLEEPWSTEPGHLDRVFAASKNLLFNAYITRAPTAEVHDYGEALWVATIIKALAPHGHRCKEIKFNLLHLTSLPAIPQFLQNSVELQYLQIYNRVNTISYEPWVSKEVNQTNETRLIGTAIFEALCNPQWVKAFKSSETKEFSVTSIHGLGDIDPSYFLNLITTRKIGFIRRLIFRDVDFPLCSPGIFRPVDVFIQRLEFHYTTASFIQDFFEASVNQCYLKSLVLHHCELPHKLTTTAWDLALRGISSSESLLEFVRDWNGFSLSVVMCDGIDDRLLDLLAEYHPTERLLYAPTLRHLEIPSHCKITPGALKRLVQTRKDEAARYDPMSPVAQRHPLPLAYVSISNPEAILSQAERKWFLDNVDAFHWGGRQLEPEPQSGNPTTEVVATSLEDPVAIEQNLTLLVLGFDLTFNSCFSFTFKVNPSNASSPDLSLTSAVPVFESPVLNGDFADVPSEEFEVCGVSCLGRISSHTSPRLLNWTMEHLGPFLSKPPGLLPAAHHRFQSYHKKALSLATRHSIRLLC